MKEGTQTLVGVQLTYIKPLDTYQIDNIYREAGRDGLAGVVIQRGFSLVLQAPIIHVVNALGDAYAPQITKIWTMWNTLVHRWYYQMSKGVTPSFVFIDERWKLWAEK